MLSAKTISIPLMALSLGFADDDCSKKLEQMSARREPLEAESELSTKFLPEAPEPQELSEAFVVVAKRLAPSVVRITTRQRAEQEEASGHPRQSPFDRFFEEFGPPRRGPRVGMGSGVVIDSDGHILTNEHVVATADEVTVTFDDGKQIKAEIVGTDPRTDLAVIKIERTRGGPEPKPAEFGHSKSTRVGEWVIAIGNPFGLDHSVTVGVLSAKERYGLAPGKLEDFLQTDASINPGNSGGPLVNLQGQVIGINTMIAGLGTGVGFAVSESIARPIAQQLIEHGKVTRPFIGVVTQALTPELRDAMGRNAPTEGALVTQVQPGSPAEEAGIRAGDVVLEVAGEVIDDSRDLQSTVLGKRVGEKLQLIVWRDGKKTKVDVRTRELPSEPERPAQPRGGSPQSDLGLALTPLTPPIAERLRLDPTTKGVVVTQLRPGGPAAEAGLRVGDVIIELDGKPVTTADDAAKRLGTNRKGGHLARVLRGNGALFVVIPNRPTK